MDTLGFRIEWNNSGDARMRRSNYSLTLPFWSIFLLICGYPLGRYIIAVIRRQREDRIALGLCPCCGEPVAENATRCGACDQPVGALKPR
jgi:hypothetical protein